MVSTLQRFRAAGVVLGLAIALAGCAAPSGAARQLTVQPPGAVGYTVCSGGYASRFPEREKVGRTCRNSTSLNGIF